MSNRDILWITLESVRQDRTSLGGHHRDTTPNLAALAGEGAACDGCYSHDIWTRSSSASILTGQAPSAHRTWSTEASLPAGITTIPESARDAGYRTVCVSPIGQLSPSTGLDAGFEHFHYLNRSTLLSEAGPHAFARWLLNIRRHSGGITRDGNQHCTGYLCNAIAKRHIDAASSKDEPLFLYLHHSDSHHAYVPPIHWRDEFADELPFSADRAVDLALDMADRRHEHISTGELFSADEWRALRTLYDTGIAYVDHLTGELVDYARTELDDPVIVVTADHGELFGERGLLGHILVANTAVTNVPLVVLGLEDFSGDGLIQHADVMRMLCADLGIEHPVPIGRDVRDDHRQFAVTQRGGERARRNLDEISRHNDGFNDDRFHTGDLTSLRTEEWRLQFSAEGSDLFALPDETTDVSEAHPAVVDRLEARGRTWIENFGGPVGDPGTAEFDEATREQLAELGYLQ
jgi:arylsulfatase A-like enzyme